MKSLPQLAPAASLYLPSTYAALILKPSQPIKHFGYAWEEYQRTGHQFRTQRLEIRGEIVLGIQQHVILPHLTHPRWT